MWRRRRKVWFYFRFDSFVVQKLLGGFVEKLKSLISPHRLGPGLGMQVCTEGAKNSKKNFKKV